MITLPPQSRLDYMFNRLRDVAFTLALLSGIVGATSAAGTAGELCPDKPRAAGSAPEMVLPGVAPNLPDLLYLMRRGPAKLMGQALGKPVVLGLGVEKYTLPTRDIVPLRPTLIWKMLDPGATVLLSDRITHHYALVGGMDRAAGTIDILDPNARQSFLRKGFNYEDVAGELVDDTHIRITRAEFERVIVGAIVFRSLDDMRSLLVLALAGGFDYRVPWAIGSTLMLEPSEDFVIIAEYALQQALSLAHDSPCKDQVAADLAHARERLTIEKPD